ncbi:MAG: hypothetical protein MJY87_02355 [Fibrobacter sp.]|nr:hypothetical protein [Fibrobacter sp.]
MTPELVAVIVSLIGSIATFLKSNVDKNRIHEQREVSRKGYDERFALLDEKIKNCEKRLDEGNDRFERFEKELRETNGLLRELIGMFKGRGMEL